MTFCLELPKNVKKIISVLENAGYEAYAVGGCVRDAILGRIPQDWDVTTSATPEQVKSHFSHTVDTGIAHGTVTVLLGGTGYEVTTYRIDGSYEDCRHPKEVTFTKSLSEDLKRRDFTINAMAYNEKEGLADPFGGREDLKKGLIRAVGNPEERFSEDALRILRAIRFAAQLGFTIDPDTEAGMRKLAGNLQAVSAERVREELTKLLASDHPEELVRASECGLTAYWLPEWDRMLQTPQHNVHHIYDVGRHTVAAIQALHETEEYRAAGKHEQNLLNYTMLLHDAAKPLCKTTDEKGSDHFYGHQKESAALAREVLRRLKFDNETVDTAEKLVLHHDIRFRLEEGDAERQIRRLANRIGLSNIALLFPVQIADIEAQAPKYRESGMRAVARMREAYAEVVRKASCVSLKTLAVKGADLMEIGFPAGPGLGEVLKRLLEDVLDNPEHNTREYLLNKALSEKE